MLHTTHEPSVRYVYRMNECGKMTVSIEVGRESRGSYSVHSHRCEEVGTETSSVSEQVAHCKCRKGNMDDFERGVQRLAVLTFPTVDAKDLLGLCIHERAAHGMRPEGKGSPPRDGKERIPAALYVCSVGRG